MLHIGRTALYCSWMPVLSVPLLFTCICSTVIVFYLYDVGTARTFVLQVAYLCVCVSVSACLCYCLCWVSTQISGSRTIKLAQCISKQDAATFESSCRGDNAVCCRSHCCNHQATNSSASYIACLQKLDEPPPETQTPGKWQ